MRKITLLAISFFGFLHLAAAQYYIQYDPSCMDKLEYHLEDGAEGKNYITFRLNKSATEKYFFQVGFDNPVKPMKSVQTIPCKDAFLDEEAMNAVNDAQKNAYIVINTPTGTRLYRVGSISYVVTGENLLSYVGDQYTFASDLLTPYENLAAQDSRSQVYFVGTETLHNKMVYHFRVEPLQGGTAVISRTFRYAPHIGIVSESIPENGVERQIDLKRVNGKSLEDYFSSVDDKLPVIILQDAPETVAETTKTTVTETSSPKTKTRQANEQGLYEIKAGDNLYAVSRSFGISLGQLRAWNHLVSDDILPGSQLMVKTPPKVNPTEALNMKGGFYEIDPGKAVTIPDDYEAKMKQKKAAAARLKNKGGETMTQSPKSEESKARAILAKGGVDAQIPLFVKREKDSGLHIVQKGETIASMAKKYKVTEAKFRRLNGMSADETARTGQVLKIAECVCEDDKPTTAPEKVTTPYSNHSKRLISKGVEAKGVEETVIMIQGKKCHVAKDGETLYSISKKHGLSVEKLREYNRMANTDLVIPKQKLFLE